MAVQWGLIKDMPAEIAGSFQQGQKNALVMQQAGQEQQLNALKLQTAGQEIQDKNALNRAFQESGGDIEKAKTALMTAGQYKPALELGKHIAERDKLAIETQKAKTEAALKNFEYIDHSLSGARNQADLDAARQHIAQNLGEEYISRIPEIYDPQAIDNVRQQALSYKDQLEQKHKVIMEGLREKEVSALGGYRQQQLAQGEERIGLQERQVSAAEQAAQKTSKVATTASEDERKAAGWLSQADNAYKNMLAAMAKNKEAAAPGWREAALGAVGLEKAQKAVQSTARQQFTQASESLSEAVLRAATGAGVNKEEAAQKVRELTPTFFDDEATKKQKLDSIPVYLESLKTRAGRAAPEGYQVPVTTGAKFLGFE